MRLAVKVPMWLFALALLGDVRDAAAGGKGDSTGIRELERNLRDVFQRANPCPVNGKRIGYCPGYFIGYVVLPKHGGKYDTANMTWMTVTEAEKSGQDRRW